MFLRSKVDLFMVGFVLIMAGCWAMYHTFFSMHRFNPRGEQVSIMKRFEIIMFTGVVILYLFMLLRFQDSPYAFTGDSSYTLAMLPILVIFAAGSIIYAKKKKMNMYEFFTLQAKDEREQIAIDHAGRKAYALMRMVIPLFGFLVMMGIFGSGLSLNEVFNLLFMLTFLGELFFRLFIRNIQSS